MYTLTAERDGAEDKVLGNFDKDDAEIYISEHEEEYEGWDFVLKNDKEIWLYLGDGYWEDHNDIRNPES